MVPLLLLLHTCIVDGSFAGTNKQLLATKENGIALGRFIPNVFYFPSFFYFYQSASFQALIAF